MRRIEAEARSQPVWLARTDNEEPVRKTHETPMGEEKSLSITKV